MKTTTKITFSVLTVGLIILLYSVPFLAFLTYWLLSIFFVLTGILFLLHHLKYPKKVVLLETKKHWTYLIVSFLYVLLNENLHNDIAKNFVITVANIWFVGIVFKCIVSAIIDDKEVNKVK